LGGDGARGVRVILKAGNREILRVWKNLKNKDLTFDLLK